MRRPDLQWEHSCSNHVDENMGKNLSVVAANSIDNEALESGLLYNGFSLYPLLGWSDEVLDQFHWISVIQKAYLTQQECSTGVQNSHSEAVLL